MKAIKFSGPEGGWKQGTLYLVDVAWGPNNPIHPAVFYSGFLDNGCPAAYSYFAAPSYVKHSTDGLYYIEVIKELVDFKGMQKCFTKMPG